MSEKDAFDSDLHELRGQARDRAATLSRQLEADRAELQRWTQLRDPADAKGIEAVERAIAAVDQVRSKLKRG
jgi:hypothetical protein